MKKLDETTLIAPDHTPHSISWMALFKNYEVSEEFIIKHLPHLNNSTWDIISQYQRLSETFITTYQNEVNWPYISKYQVLSEKFITQHCNRVSWFLICIYQQLSEEYILTNLDKVDLHTIQLRYHETYIRYHLDIYHTLRRT